MFRDKMKALRAEHGLTQEQLSRLLGIERSSVGKYESRQGVIPSAEVLQKIADLFHVSIDYLLDRESPPSLPDLEEDADNLVIIKKSGRRMVRQIPPEKMDLVIALIDSLSGE